MVTQSALTSSWTDLVTLVVRSQVAPLSNQGHKPLAQLGSEGKWDPDANPSDQSNSRTQAAVVPSPL